jgi:hypothetical protein
MTLPTVGISIPPPDPTALVCTLCPTDRRPRSYVSLDGLNTHLSSHKDLFLAAGPARDVVTRHCHKHRLWYCCVCAQFSKCTKLKCGRRQNNCAQLPLVQNQVPAGVYPRLLTDDRAYITYMLDLPAVPSSPITTLPLFLLPDTPANPQDPPLDIPTDFGYLGSSQDIANALFRSNIYCVRDTAVPKNLISALTVIYTSFLRQFNRESSQAHGMLLLLAFSKLFLRKVHKPSNAAGRALRRDQKAYQRDSILAGNFRHFGCVLFFP